MNLLQTTTSCDHAGALEVRDLPADAPAVVRPVAVSDLGKLTLGGI